MMKTNNANKIRDLRKQIGLSQTKFGELFGIPLRTIQEWEYERRTPPAYVVNMIEELCYHRGLIACKAVKNPFAKIHQAALANGGALPGEVRKEMMEEAIREVRTTLQTNDDVER